MKEASPAITLQRASEQHIDELVALYSHPHVTRQTLQMPYPSAELWRKRLSVESERLLPLIALYEGQVIGNCSLEQHARVRRAHTGSIGMAVAHDWQGQGVGTRLLAAVLDVADNWMSLLRVELTVFADNKPALALYQRHGFEVEGQLRDYAMRDGRLTDVYSMARLHRRER